MPVVFVTGATTGFVPVMVYEIPEPGAGDVTVIVPVETVHVGCAVTVAVGAAGALGTVLTVNEIAKDVHPALVVVTSYTPGASNENMPVVFVTGATTGFVPVRVYEIPEPGAGDVTVIVPVVTAHVGCATDVVGAAGAPGTGLTVNEVAVDTHPALVVVTS